jgi:hypothetical protein
MQPFWSGQENWPVPMVINAASTRETSIMRRLQ